MVQKATCFCASLYVMLTLYINNYIGLKGDVSVFMYYICASGALSYEQIRRTHMPWEKSARSRDGLLLRVTGTDCLEKD